MSDTGTSLKTFQQIFASAAEEEVCWWYFGAMNVIVADWPQLPVLFPVTIMVYRTENVSDIETRIHYREVGYFRDPRTGKLADKWFNPVTGETVEAAKTFVEGPSCYTIRQTESGLTLSLEQAHATVTGLDVSIAEQGGRLLLTQNEYKSRGFPRPDGTMSTNFAKGHTTLSFFASAAEVATGAECVSSAGAYTFNLDCLPGWTGFGDLAGRTSVVGIVQKAGMTERLNATDWNVLRGEFPDFFSGDRIRPIWN